MSNTHFNVIIVGAGVTGLVLAARLARLDLTIVVVDAHDFPKVLPDGSSEAGVFSPRVSALNHFSQKVFSELNVWPKCREYAGFYSKMHVWDSQDNVIDFDCRELGRPELGAIVENDRLRYHLLEELRAHSNVVLLANSPAVELLQVDDSVNLTLAGGDSLSSDLLVAADGARSWVREQAEFELTEWEYGHTAIIAHVQTEHNHQQVARQKFLATGPLAFLPMPDDDWCSIVWSTSPDEAGRLMALEDAHFCEALSAAFDHKLGQVVSVTRRFNFPLTMRHAKRYLNNNIVLIGDAAHTIHPLAGQGMNVGIQDGVELAEQIAASVRQGQSVSCRKYLRRYERARKADNWQMILMMEFLKRIFASESRQIQQALSFGLTLTGKHRSLKTLFLKVAQGPDKNISDCT